MTSALDIQIELLNGAQAGDPCRVRIASGETVFTNLIREQGRAHDDAVLAAPEPLAFWLCDNWWRLRWETIPPNGLSSASWRLAHDIAAVGGGYSGDDSACGVISIASACSAKPIPSGLSVLSAISLMPWSTSMPHTSNAKWTISSITSSMSNADPCSMAKPCAHSSKRSGKSGPILKRRDGGDSRHGSAQSRPSP